MIFTDWIGAIVAWVVFFTYRKYVETPELSFQQYLDDDRLVIGLIVIPLVWICIWWMIGSYREVYFLSRIQLMYNTALGSLLGSLGLLFTILRDDFTLTVISYAQLFLAVFLIHMIVFGFLRLVISTFLKFLASSGRVKLYGTLTTDGDQLSISHSLLYDISLSDLDEMILSQKSDALLVDITDQDILDKKVPQLIGRAARRLLMISPRSFAVLSDGYRGVPSISHDLISLKTSPLYAWQENIKRMIDIFGALSIMLIASPIMLLLAIGVKRSSAGGIIYRQERVGRFGKPFQILKFRSMIEDAETSGPQLAKEDDTRTTSLGRWMRRWRLDELPQCINVLRGDMSLVGPRPERPYYADQLIAREAKYALIYQVRPGVTSWGQIKYGYASSIDEMLKRFRYDLLYMEQMSLVLDFKILIYTIAVLLRGQGR